MEHTRLTRRSHDFPFFIRCMILKLDSSLTLRKLFLELILALAF